MMHGLPAHAGEGRDQDHVPQSLQALEHTHLFFVGFATLVGSRAVAVNPAPDERFDAYWPANGGLPVFGYAMSAATRQYLT